MKRFGQYSTVGIAVFVICALAGFQATVFTRHGAYVIVGLVAGAYFFFSIKVVNQWERVAILRFGRYKGLRGPGVFMLVPGRMLGDLLRHALGY